MGMKLIAAALAGALASGVAVYWWRDQELASRQERLLDAARSQTYAELLAERLQEKMDAMRKDMRRLRGSRSRAQIELERLQEQPLPQLTTLPGDKYFGYIRVIDRSVEPVLVVDLAQWFIGDEAVEAAKEDGAIGPRAKYVPNDYYIRNENPLLRTLAITEDADVRVLTPDLPDLKRVSLSRFQTLFERKSGFHWGHRHSPYWITVENEGITKIEEQYLP